MSYDLTNESGADLRLSNTGWALLLNLAEAYGWTPKGSLPPEGLAAAEWTGDYDTNDGERVSQEDARAMADALERALADPERTVKEQEIGRELIQTLRIMEIEAFGEDLTPEKEAEMPATDDEFLRTFIRFLRAGSFRID